MMFSYNTYWEVTCFLPMTFIFLMLIFLVSYCYGLWKKISCAGWVPVDVIKLIIIILLAVTEMFSQSKVLQNGGIYLLEESEEDVCVYTGFIEDVREPSERFPGFKASHRYGADILIDGEWYFAVTCAPYAVGDQITIQYMPKSKFILSISGGGDVENILTEGTF